MSRATKTFRRFRELLDIDAATLAALSDGSTFALQLNAGKFGATAVPAPDLSGYATTSATNTALAGKADLVGGKLDQTQLPDIAISDFLGNAANQAAMLALTGQKGDWTIRTDTSQVWIITGSNPTQLGSWTSLAYPVAPVTSVASRTGNIDLAQADIAGLTTASTPTFSGIGVTRTGLAGYFMSMTATDDTTTPPFLIGYAINDDLGGGTDTVFSLGVNLQAGNGRADNTKPAFGIVMENRFFIDVLGTSKPQHEFHITATDASGWEHRPLTFGLPHDGGAGSAIESQIDAWHFSTYAGVEKLQMNWTNGVISTAAPIYWSYGVNNVPIAKQRNATGDAFLNLPYLDDDDRFRVAQPVRITGPIPSGGDYPSVFMAIAPSAGMPNDVIQSINVPGGVGGDIYASQIIGNINNGSILNYIQQNGNGDAIFRVRALGGGDPIVWFGTATNHWMAGIDRSDGNRFKITASDQLGISSGAFDAVVINPTTLAVTLGGNLTVSGGTITGGASGLTLAAGGTNQNITLTPSGTGKVLLNGSGGKLNIANIPTSASGLSSGDVWSNSGVLTIV